jgi:hypothetical protein
MASFLAATATDGRPALQRKDCTISTVVLAEGRERGMRMLYRSERA